MTNINPFIGAHRTDRATLKDLHSFQAKFSVHKPERLHGSAVLWKKATKPAHINEGGSLLKRLNGARHIKVSVVVKRASFLL